MASGKSSKAARGAVARGSAPVVRQRQGLPWLTIAAFVVVLALIGTIFGVVYSKQHAKNVAADAQAELTSTWGPTATKMDPSTTIPGIYVGASVPGTDTITYPKYKALLHVTDAQRVNYDRYPPVGGPHDQYWADCSGHVYATAVRDENMVHTLEHGAIWIAYNPKTIAAGDLDVLKKLVNGVNYMSLSPYPTLDQPISLQSWAHQLKVTSAADARVAEFITALKENPYITPEVNGNCVASSGFDVDNPPAFDSAPRGEDAIGLDGAGLAQATDENGAAGVVTTVVGSGSEVVATGYPGSGSAASGSAPSESATPSSAAAPSGTSISK